jgi:hypothetical protein
MAEWEENAEDFARSRRVEALAGALGLERERLPALISQLQKSGKVSIGWGGVVEVLPEQATERPPSSICRGRKSAGARRLQGETHVAAQIKSCRSHRSGQSEPWPRFSSAAGITMFAAAPMCTSAFGSRAKSVSAAAGIAAFSAIPVNGERTAVQ